MIALGCVCAYFSCDRQDVINYEKGNKMQRLAKSPRVLRCASGGVKLFPLFPLKQ